MTSMFDFLKVFLGCLVLLSACNKAEVRSPYPSGGKTAGGSEGPAGTTDSSGGAPKALPVAPLAAIRLALEPGDRSTSVKGSPLQLAITHTLALAPGTLEPLAGLLKLEIWPEGVEIPSKAVLSQESAQGTMAYVTVTPTSEPGDRWLALHLTSVPDGMRMVESGDYIPDSKGGFLVRLRPGAQTVITTISRAWKGTKTMVYLAFSERVAVAADVLSADVVKFSSGGVSYDCQVENMPALDQAVKQVAVACAERLPTTYTVAIPESVFLTADGKPAMEAQTIVVDDKTVTQSCGEDCFIVRP
jgi:hypothetical protein